MANPFIEYIIQQIESNPALSDPGTNGGGARARAFDDIPLSGDAAFGREAQAFFKQAPGLYKKDIFKPPYSKERIDVLHEIFIKLNTDIEKDSAWAELESHLKAKNPALTGDDISRMKNQFLAAYRYKVLSWVNGILQEQFKDKHLEIIRVAGPFLQNVNVAMKDDAKASHRNKEDLLRELIKDSQKELTTALTGKNSFSEFYGTKVQKLMENLGPPGFDVVFKHFNATNRTLTHEKASLASPKEIQDFCNLILVKCSEDKEFRKYISEDPAAFVFLQKAKQTLDQAKVDDSALSKFMGGILDKSPYSQNNLLSQLKAVEKKLDKGDLKEKVGKIIKTLESDPTLNRAIIDDIKRVKLQLEVENFQSTKKSPALEGLKAACEAYIKIEQFSRPAVMPAAPASSASASVAAASATVAAVDPPAPLIPPVPATADTQAKHTPLIFHFPQASALTQDIEPKTAKELFADALKAIAQEIHDIGKERDMSLLRLSEKICIAVDDIMEQQDPAKIETTIDDLKTQVSQFERPTQAAASRARSIDVTKINEDIGKAYTQFQEKMQSEDAKPKAAKLGL